MSGVWKAGTDGPAIEVRRLFTIQVPDQLMPGHIDNHKTLYLPNVWIGKDPRVEDRNLFFNLSVPGYEFEHAHAFHEVYKEHPEIAQTYFSNPLDVAWTNRQMHLAFILQSGEGDTSPFELIVRDENAEATFNLDPGHKWACFSDGSQTSID